VSGWRHNDDEARWEYGYDDIPREAFVLIAYVTDEMIERVAFPVMIARRLHERVGSVPPPLREHLPPGPPVAFPPAAAP
jgi:hypothetical protein